jgi:hypothetical protein
LFTKTLEDVKMFKWNIAANLNDDLVAHFLKAFNVCGALVYNAWTILNWAVPYSNLFPYIR